MTAINPTVRKLLQAEFTHEAKRRGFHDPKVIISARLPYTKSVVVAVSERAKRNDRPADIVEIVDLSKVDLSLPQPSQFIVVSPPMRG